MMKTESFWDELSGFFQPGTLNPEPLNLGQHHMKIRIHLYTILKKYGEGKIDENNTMRLPQPLSLQGLAAYLNIPEKPGKNYLVNNTPRPKEYILKDGDVVKIFGFICGG